MELNNESATNLFSITAELGNSIGSNKGLESDSGPGGRWLNQHWLRERAWDGSSGITAERFRGETSSLRACAMAICDSLFTELGRVLAARGHENAPVLRSRGMTRGDHRA